MPALGRLGEKAEKTAGKRSKGGSRDWLHKIDIVDLLEGLGMDNISQATGDEIVCSCPFPGHTRGDRKPSLYMNDGSKDQSKATVWKCHGCGRAGNAIGLVASLDESSKQKAAQHLRERYAPDWLAPREGIAKEFNDRRLMLKQQAMQQALEELRTIPWDRYEKLFGIEWPAGAGASDFAGTPAGYMYERGFTSETLNTWRIGWDEKSERIVIPVTDEDGNLVGVKGRTTDPDRKPKYLILGDRSDRRTKRYGFKHYEKSLVVFGIDQLKGSTWAVFCEGELDVLALHQIGIPAICTGSAHLSDEQARIIRDHLDEVIVLFDTDEAGKNATWGYTDDDDDVYHPGLVYKLERFIGVRVVRDHRYDPSKMIQLGKEEGLRRMIENAVVARRHPLHAMIPLHTAEPLT